MTPSSGGKLLVWVLKHLSALHQAHVTLGYKKRRRLVADEAAFLLASGEHDIMMRQKT